MFIVGIGYYSLYLLDKTVKNYSKIFRKPLVFENVPPYKNQLLFHFVWQCGIQKVRMTILQNYTYLSKFNNTLKLT